MTKEQTKKVIKAIILCITLFVSCAELFVIFHYLNNFVNGYTPTDFLGTVTGDTVYGFQAIKQDGWAHLVFMPVINVASLFQILYFGITIKKDKDIKKKWLKGSIILIILNILLWVWVLG